MISVMNNDYEFDKKSDVSTDFKVESPEKKTVDCGVEPRIDGGSNGVSSCGVYDTEETSMMSLETGAVSDELEKNVEIRGSDNLHLSGRSSGPDVGQVEHEVRVFSSEIDSKEMDDNLEFRLSEVELVEERHSELEQFSMKEERDGVYFLERKGGNIEKVMEGRNVLDFNSAYSRVDEGTAARMSEAFGSEAAKAFKYGFEPGDMVWGKVKSHPWWPGQIFNGSLATSSVRHTKREGHLLVAFFGDNSYGWFDPAELIPFEPHYSEKSQQTNSRTFMKAVEDAVDETQRRAALGLTCYCRNPFNFRPTNVQGYFAVDMGGYEPGFLYSVKQIKKARDNFHPVEALSFVQQLAMEPRNNDQTSIDYIKNVAFFLAYRKATFEEFDETYSQAFGTQPASFTCDSKGMLDRPAKFPSQAPLSGPLVFAETLGEVKSTTKLSKVKDQSKKDKYLLKRRDSMDEPKVPHFSQAHASFVTSSGYKEEAAATMPGDFVLQKRIPSASISMKYQVATQPKGIQTISQEDAGLISSEAKFNMVDAQGIMNRFDLPAGSPIEYPRIPVTCSSTSTIQDDLDEGKLCLDKDMDVFPGMNGRVTPAGTVGFTSTGLDGSIVLEKLEPPGILDSIDHNLQHESKILVDLKQEESANLSSMSDGLLASPVKDCRGVDLVSEGVGSRNVLKSVGTLPIPGDLKVPDKILISDGAAKLKKVKILKRPRNLISDKTSTGEIKKKKKKQVGLEAFPNQTTGKFLGIGMAPGEKSQVVPQRKSNGISSATISDLAVPPPKVDLGNIDLQLPQLLSDLLTLALDPFHGVERNSPTIVRHVLLQFRSLVYQKSLVLAPLSEAQTSELCDRKSSTSSGTTGISSGDNPMPPKLLKPLARPDDPTKAGRKRGASDCQEEMSAKRAKKVKDLKALTTEKKAGSQKILEQKPEEQKEAVVTAPTKLTKAEILKRQQERREAGFTVPSKPIKPEIVKRSEPLVRVAEPTMLVMMFPPRTTLPSVPELKAKFARFGPLDPSAFRVFWKSSTCRVVFKYKSHAQTAYRFAVQNKGFFGQLKVNYQLKDVSVPAPEVPESAKRRQDDHASDDFQSFRPGLGSDSLGGEPRRSLQPASQLKSCLKKSSGEETTEAVIGGSRENPRVKFILDGEASSRTEQSMVSSCSRNQNKNNTIGSSSEPVVCGSPSPTLAMDLNSKKFQKLFPPPLPPLLVPPLPPPPPPPPHNLDMHENHGMGHFSNATTHPSYTRVVEERMNNNNYTNIIRSSNTNSIDFSTKFLSLLMRCSDIVTDVRSSLGHVPYQPL